MSCARRCVHRFQKCIDRRIAASFEPGMQVIHGHAKQRRITVLDRPKLEGLICERHEAVRRETDRLFSAKTF